MNYLKKIFSTGAIRKTPSRILKKITSLIQTDKPLSIMELGAGQGEITSAVINKIPAPKTYLAFEIDKNYYQKLSVDFPQIKVMPYDAFAFNSHLNGTKADLIISSIPLSFYKKEKIEKLLEAIQDALQPGGSFIIIFHAFWLLPMLRKKFPGNKVEVFVTLPVYFLFTSITKD